MCWWQVYNINLSNKYWIHLKVTLTVYKVDSYGTAWLHYAGHHRPIQHFHVDLTMTHAWFSLQILLYRCPWLIAFHPQLKFWKSLLIVVFRQPHVVCWENWSDNTQKACVQVIAWIKFPKTWLISPISHLSHLSTHGVIIIIININQS